MPLRVLGKVLRQVSVTGVFFVVLMPQPPALVNFVVDADIGKGPENVKKGKLRYIIKIDIFYRS
jgi:hypothetical protein